MFRGVFFRFCYLEEPHAVLELVTSLENIFLVFAFARVFRRRLQRSVSRPGVSDGLWHSAETTNTLFPPAHKEREQQK